MGCEVDFPVALVYQSKHYPRWHSAEDVDYWIHFVPNGQSPLSVDPIKVPRNNDSPKLDITGLPHYYKYKICLQQNCTDDSNKCKDAEDERDTGLNVKP